MIEKQSSWLARPHPSHRSPPPSPFAPNSHSVQASPRRKKEEEFPSRNFHSHSLHIDHAYPIPPPIVISNSPHSSISAHQHHQQHPPQSLSQPTTNQPIIDHTDRLTLGGNSYVVFICLTIITSWALPKFLQSFCPSFSKEFGCRSPSPCAQLQSWGTLEFSLVVPSSLAIGEREREREFRLSRYLGGVDRLLGLRGFEFGDIVVGYQGAGILRSMLGE